MKNRCKFLLCFILILMISILSGCTDKPTLDNIDPPPKPSAILETKQPLGDSNTLFYIPNETVESGLMQTLAPFCNNFLLCRTDETGYHLKLISSETGAELLGKSFPDTIMPNVQICENKIALTDWCNGKIWIFDENLQELESYQVPCEYNSMYVSPDTEKVYVFLPENGINVTTLATGETEVLLKEASQLYSSNEFKTIITFSYTDRKSQFDMFGAINLETGELIDFPFEGSFYNLYFTNDTWVATQSGPLNLHYIGNKHTVKTLDFGNESEQITLSPDTGHLLVTTYNDSGFSKLASYDINGKFISECVNTLEGTVVQGRPFWSAVDGGYYFIMIDPSGKDMLMFWDVNADCSGEDVPLQDLQEEVLPENAVSKELYARAKEISSTYGVTIRIAEQISKDNSTYTVETCLDEKMISKALDEVEKVLQVYPKRFFEQLLYGSIYKVEIDLTGSLEMNDIPDDSGNGFTSFTGFASAGDGSSSIIIDIFSLIESCLHHEIFHLIDYKLTFDSGLRPESNYSEEEWAKLNPADFEYAGRLYNLPDSFYNGKHEEWFTGYYARTSSMEDRATIMEHAAIGDHNMFIHAPYRQAKLEYLSKCIRDAFDTTGWPEVTVWEETLNKSR